MKKTTKIIGLLSLLVGLTLVSCNKEEPSGGDNDGPTTLAVTNNLGDLVTLNATLPSEASSGGFAYSTSSNPSIDNATQVVGSTGGADSIYSTAIVEPLSNYYVRAYAWIDGSIVYGNEVTFSTGYAVGQSYGGGIIGYILQSGDPGYSTGEEHGLIFAEDILGSDVEWGCEGTDVPDTQLSIGSGAYNTAAIVAECGEAGIAARLCDDLTVGGFDDWILPSYSDLRAIDENYEQLPITGGYYFSSSQASSDKAWAIYLWNPPVVEGPSDYGKSYGQKVLAVRYF